MTIFDNNIDQKILRNIEKFRPIDDAFMRELFRNDIPLVQRILRIIMGIEDLQIISSETQYDLKRLLGSRSLCLDVIATDSEGKIFNIEIQRSNEEAKPQRARYHSSAIDIEFLKAKSDFKELPVSYVIFITENDIIGDNRLIYHYEWQEIETNKPLNDGAHIIYVNSSYNNKDDTSELSKLAHDFLCADPNKMYIKELADKTRYFKKTVEGVNNMCQIMEDFRDEITADVTKKVTQEVTADVTKKVTEDVTKKNSSQTAVKLLEKKMGTFEDISEITGLSIDEIKELAEKINN